MIKSEKERWSVISKINIALQKMEQLGKTDNIGYQNLLFKRDALMLGFPYKRLDVTEQVIGECGKLFSAISKYHNLDKFD